MSTAGRFLARCVRRLYLAWQCYHLRTRITQLTQLVQRPDLWLYSDEVERDQYDAKLAELHSRLYALELLL